MLADVTTPRVGTREGIAVGIAAIARWGKVLWVKRRIAASSTISMNADNICDVVGTVDWPKNLNFELSKSLCVCGQGVSRPNLFFRSLRHDRKKKQKKTREF